MKAITTTLHGPTDTRGSRIVATEPDGKRVTRPYDHALNLEDNHKAAAVALCDRLAWYGTLATGYLGGSRYCHVWIDASRIEVRRG